MKNLFEGDNKNLLILGGIALVAAYYLMNRSTTAQDNGTSGGSTDLSNLFGGPTPQALPDTIYQFPPEGQVNFPQQDKTDWENLLKNILGGLNLPGNEEITTTKKEAFLDAGDSYGTGTLKKPFMSGGQPNYYTAPGNTFGDLVSPDGTFNSQNYAITGYTPPPVVANGGGITGYSKKEMITPFGFQNQAFFDPISGFDQWNNYAGYVVDPKTGELIGNGGGFGMSRDPVTGDMVPFQRDIYIIDSFGNELYNPVTKKGNALIQISQDNRGGPVIGLSAPWDSLNTFEKAQVISQAQPNYVTNSGDYSVGYANLAAAQNTYLAKKQAAINVEQTAANEQARTNYNAEIAANPVYRSSGEVYFNETLGAPVPYPGATTPITYDQALSNIGMSKKDGNINLPTSFNIGGSVLSVNSLTARTVTIDGATYKAPFISAGVDAGSSKKEMTISASIAPPTPAVSNVTASGTHTAAYMALYNGG